jgi:hypothetical protein
MEPASENHPADGTVATGEIDLPMGRKCFNVPGFVPYVTKGARA